MTGESTTYTYNTDGQLIGAIETTEQNPSENGGCDSMMNGSAVVLVALIALSALQLTKKKEQEKA